METKYVTYVTKHSKKSLDITLHSDLFLEKTSPMLGLHQSPIYFLFLHESIP